MFEAFYGLRATPFRLAPDPKIFYESACHKRGFAYLRYGLQQSQGFVVVTGIPGTGKTLLVQMLFSELAASRRIVVAVLSNPNLGDTDILRAVANCFDIHYPDDNKAGLLGAIERFLLNQRRQGKHVLLVVDEAQNLPKKSLEELRMLTNYQLDENALMQIMLLGQQQLQQILADPSMEQLTQRVIATCHLTPLEALDTRAYIEHRLRCVDWQGRPSFSADALRLIHHYSRGIPRLINTLCERLLLAASIEEKDHIDESHLIMVLRELREESCGAWNKSDSPSVVELPPLPDGEFIPSAPEIRDEETRAETSQPLPKQAVSGEDVAWEERVVTPYYDLENDDSAGRKKGLFGGGRSKKDGQKHGTAHEVDDVVIPRDDPPEKTHPAEKKGLSGGGRDSSQSEERDAPSLLDMSTPDAEPEGLRPDALTPNPVQFDEAKKGRWWLMPAVAGILIVVGMVLFVVFSDGETRRFVQNMLPSSVSLPQSLSGSTAQQIEQKNKSQEEEPTVPASTVKPAPEKQERSHMPPSPPAGNQIQTATAPIATPVAINDVVSTEANDGQAGVVNISSLPFMAKGGEDLSLPPPMVIEVKEVAADDASPLVPQEIYNYELPDLIDSFSYAYENGDLERFVDLFTVDAFLDDSDGKQKIAQDYREVFQATDMRSLDIKKVDWQPEGGKARGDGLFELTVRHHGKAVPSSVKGKINIEVVKEAERLYIKKLSMVAE